jgi:hypothetical protein
MTSLKAAGNAAVYLNSVAPAGAEGSEKSPNGWDPYEVWRTRVLLPRLEEKLLVAERNDSPTKPFLVRSA